MRILKIVLALALFFIALALGAQNQEMVTFNYLIAEGEFHLSWLIGAIFLFGFISSGLILGTICFRLQLQLRKLKKQLSKSTSQTEKLEKSTVPQPVVKESNK